MAEDNIPNLTNLSIDELQEYIETQYSDVLWEYQTSTMSRRSGIFLEESADGSLYLDTINIHPTAQGQGKGAEILEIIKSWADANKTPVYIKPAALPDNPYYKGLETTPEQQSENLFNFYKNNGWSDNPNFTSMTKEEQAAQLSLSSNAEWGTSTDELYSPLVYTPEGVDVPELPKNPYKDSIISFTEKFNKEGKLFLEGYNQPILDEILTEVLKIEHYYGTSGFLDEADWNKSKFSKIAQDLESKGIHPNDAGRISKYIPSDKILTPAEIFKDGKRNEFFTDGIVDMLSESGGSFFSVDPDTGDELFPENRPKRDLALYNALSTDDADEAAKRIADYTKKHGDSFGPPDSLNWIKYQEREGIEMLSIKEFEKAVDELIPDTPTGLSQGPGAAAIDEIAFQNTQLIDNLPIEQVVKDRWKNMVTKRYRNLVTPGGLLDAVDVWEFGVMGLMMLAIAYKEYDEIPTLLKNSQVTMFNNMTSQYGIEPIQMEQYDSIDYEFMNKVLETGEKVMPTDILIKKVGDVVKGVGETGTVTGFGYVPTTPEKTDTMETTQKIQPGVQEEKMFKKKRPKKSAGGGSGVKIL